MLIIPACSGTPATKVTDQKLSEAQEWYDKGVVLLEENKDYDGAIKAFDKTIEIDPQFAEAYCNRGGAKGELGDYTGEIEDYNKAIEINPKFAAVYCNRGRAKLVTDDYKGAIEDCNKAIEINPKLAEAYWGRGLAKEKAEDYNGAIEDLLKAIELDPNLKSELEPLIDGINEELAEQENQEDAD